MTICATDCGCACHDTSSVIFDTLGIPPEALTPTERTLLAALCPPTDRFVLFADVWQALGRDEPWRSERSRGELISTHIHRIRRKLPPYGWAIQTCQFLGWKLARCEPSNRPAVVLSRHTKLTAFLADAVRQQQVVDAIAAGASIAHAFIEQELSSESLQYLRRIAPAFGQRVSAARTEAIASNAPPPTRKAIRAAEYRQERKAARALERARQDIPEAPPASTLNRALSAGLCAVAGCETRLAGHPRCTRCELLIGPRHTQTHVDADGLCGWCQQQRQALGRIANGLQAAERRGRQSGSQSVSV